MTDPDTEGRARQFEIDRLCAEYADAVEAGRPPNIRDFLGRYPQYAGELADYIASYHLFLAGMPEQDETPIAQLSTGSLRALEMARAELAKREAAMAQASAAAQGASTADFVSLEDRAFDLGSEPAAVAERVGLTPRLLARLDAHTIAANTLPRELFRRLSAALDVSIEAVTAYLGASPQASGAFFDADQAPTGAQEDFLSAIAASDLDPQRQAEWRALSASDTGDTGDGGEGQPG